MKTKITLFLFILLLMKFPLFSQQKAIDSLNRLIRESTGREKAEYLISLAEIYLTLDDRVALKFGEQSFSLANEVGDSSLIIKATRINGHLYNRLTRYKEAKSALSAVLHSARNGNDIEEYKKIVSDLAFAYTFLQKYDSALKLNYEILELRRNENIPDELAFVLNNLALLYDKLSDHEKAFQFYTEALNVKRTSGTSKDLDRLLINTAFCLNSMGQYKKALESIANALVQCERNCSREIVAEAEFAQGISYFHLNNHAEAKTHFSKSLGLAKESGYRFFESQNLWALGLISSKFNDKDSALMLLTSAERIAAEGGHKKVLVDVYRALADVYLSQNQFLEASQYNSRYIELNETMYNEQLRMNLSKIEIEHIERENKAKIASQNQIIALREEVIDQQQLLNFLIGAVLVVLLTIAGLLIRANRQKQRTNELLDKKVKERTEALAQSYDELVKASQERDMIIERTCQQLISSASSIRETCEGAIEDAKSEEEVEYFRRLYSSTTPLLSIAKSLKHRETTKVGRD